MRVLVELPNRRLRRGHNDALIHNPVAHQSPYVHVADRLAVSEIHSSLRSYAFRVHDGWGFEREASFPRVDGRRRSILNPRSQTAEKPRPPRPDYAGRGGFAASPHGQVGTRQPATGFRLGDSRRAGDRSGRCKRATPQKCRLSPSPRTGAMWAPIFAANRRVQAGLRDTTPPTRGRSQPVPAEWTRYGRRYRARCVDGAPVVSRGEHRKPPV